MTDTFERFFKDNYKEVESRVRSAGASPDTATEATQEAFTRAYQRWWRLNRYTNPAAWVQRVALNHRVDIERTSQRQRSVIAALPVEHVTEDEGDPLVQAAIESLPHRQQAAVQGFYTEGKSSAAVADEMGISSGAVRFHLNQARTKLRPMLAADPERQEA